ncbi:LINE-1 retrotransposable element ORF2 protein [Linum perenne]
MGPTKAPGPDGFPWKFFQEDWGKVGMSVYSEVKGFFDTSILPPNWNDTNITLIPKTQTPEYISQYRPISVTNFRAKIVSKIIATRLKPYLPSLISELQSAFMGNQSIQYNIVVAHEVVHKLKLRKKVDQGNIQDLKLNSRCLTLHHILFVDDTVLFGKATILEARRFILPLIWSGCE